MQEICTIQLHAHGHWHDVGSVSLLGQERVGWQARTYTGYALAWAMEHAGKTDAHAFASRFTVGIQAFELPHWPVFLIDMLPQGFGRQELLKRLGWPETTTDPADWQLLCTGAGNPIGNLRIKEAAHWLQQDPGPLHGFTDLDVARRGHDFTDYLGSHGLFVAGSSGIQGEWPKLLLTRARDGLLYLDHTLPDEEATAHYIVKFGRGTNERLAQILRQEAPYMALAEHLGLRVHAPLVMQEKALFIPRFDRRPGTDGTLERLAQESIATLTNQPGFGQVPSHDQVCRQLMLRCHHPQTEILEYLKRDIANLALGNKDNHARNTALQRDLKGHVALTPLYDFAPMYLHPDGIARRIRWENNDDGKTDWTKVVDRVHQLSLTPKDGPPVPLERQMLVEGLQAMAPALADIARRGHDMGLERDVHAHLRLGIEQLARQLDVLR
jgi:serine/threonine-protein kinase HipA